MTKPLKIIASVTNNKYTMKILETIIKVKTSDHGRSWALNPILKMD